MNAHGAHQLLERLRKKEKHLDIEVSLAQRFPASSVLAREGAGCGSVGDVTGAWLGTNGGSLWLWCCLAQPGALGP